MKNEVYIILIAVIALFLATNYFNSYTGEAKVHVSGTCHDGCCFKNHDTTTTIKVECIEKYLQNNTDAICVQDIGSLNSNCKCIPYTSSMNVINSGGLSGCYISDTKDSKKEGQSSGFYTAHCTGSSAVTYRCSQYGNCMPKVVSCKRNEKCVIESGELKCKVI